MITNTRPDVVDNGVFLDELLKTKPVEDFDSISSEIYTPMHIILTELYQKGEGVLGDFCSEDIAKLVYEKRCDSKSKIHYTFDTIEDFAKYERQIFNKIKEDFIPIEDPSMLIDNIDSVLQFKESIFTPGFKSENSTFNIGIIFTGNKTTNIDENTVDIVIFTPYWYVLDMYSVPVSEIKEYLNELILEYYNEEN